MRIARLSIAAAAALALPCVAAPDVTADDVQIEQWEVPWANTRPRDPYVAPDGRVWFVGQTGHYAGVLDPDTGEFERHDMNDGAGPHTVVIDRDGNAWYAGNRDAHIGRIDPDSGGIERIDTPKSNGGDPHSMVFADDGNLWFTVQWGNAVGHLDIDSGEVRLIDVPTERARPYGIRVDSAGRPWVVAFGTHKLVTVDPGTMVLSEIELPREAARPRRLEIDDRDRIWYVDHAEGYLGRYDPADGSFREWRMPGQAMSAPYATALDGKGRIWVSETGVDPVYLAVFDPESEAFVARAAIPGGGGSIRHMHYDAERDAVWFGTDRNTIGRATLP